MKNPVKVSINIKYKLLLIQLLIAIVISSLSLIAGIDTFIATALGCGTAIIANYSFAYFCFRYFGARLAQQVVASLFIGVLCKIVIAGVAFIAILVFLPGINFILVLTAFLLVQVLGTIIVSLQ